MALSDNYKNDILALVNSVDFVERVNSRSFEEEVTKIVKSIKIDDVIYSEFKNEIDNNLKDNKDYAFTCFYVLFTLCRRQSYKNIYHLASSYEDQFSCYPIYKHLLLMAKENTTTSKSEMKQLLLEARNLANSEGEHYNFKEQVGVLNAYVSIVCKYFETNLDEREEPFGEEILKDAFKVAGKLVKDGNNSYPKFILNLGRILVLRRKYEAGEAKITEAISLIPDGIDRLQRVNEFNQYLTKSALIRAHDSTKDEVKELDKVKVSNYKTIALVTSIVGFLLGGIEIFAKITNATSLTFLLIMYAFLMLTLVGIVLLGLSISMKDIKKKDIVYDSLVLAAGVVGIIVMLILLSSGIIVIA